MKFLVIAFFTLIIFDGCSQTSYIGRVLDFETKKPLKDVEIYVDTLKTKTNSAGFFQIAADTTKHLATRLKGYVENTIKFPSSNRFSFYLRKEIDNNNEFVAKFYTYLGQNLNYPASARARITQENSIIYFETDTLSKVVLVKPLNGVDNEFSKEVVRVLKRAPEVWFRITRNQKFALPVNFLISGSKSLIVTTPKLPQEVIMLPEMVVTAHIN